MGFGDVDDQLPSRYHNRKVSRWGGISRDIIDLDEPDPRPCQVDLAGDDLVIDLEQEEALLNDETFHQRTPQREETRVEDRKSFLNLSRIVSTSSQSTEIESYPWENSFVKAGKTVQLANGTFLHIKSVIRNTETNAISLRGWQLKRSKDLCGLLPKKLNELCYVYDVDLDDPRPLSEQRVQDVALSDIVKMRKLICTIRPFPDCSWRLTADRLPHSQSRIAISNYVWKYITTFANARDRLKNTTTPNNFRRQQIEPVSAEECSLGFNMSGHDQRQNWRGTTTLGGSSNANVCNVRQNSSTRGQYMGSPNKENGRKLPSECPERSGRGRNSKDELQDKHRRNLHSKISPMKIIEKLPQQKDPTEPVSIPKIIDLTDGDSSQYHVKSGAKSTRQFDTSKVRNSWRDSHGSRSLPTLEKLMTENPKGFADQKAEMARLDAVRVIDLRGGNGDDEDEIWIMEEGVKNIEHNTKIGNDPNHGTLEGTTFSKPYIAFPRSRVGGRSRQKYTYGDAFCGAGGMTRGALMAGLKVVWGLDFNADAGETWRRNFPDARFFQEWANEFVARPDEHRHLVVDILHLSPPCQVFSPVHTREGNGDDMNFASLFAVEGLIEKARPRLVTLEQTFGILHTKFKGAFNSLVRMFMDHGFSTSWQVVELQRFGLAQRRKRLIIIAAGPGETLPGFPSYTHSENGDLGWKPYNTVKNVLSSIAGDASNHDLLAAFTRANHMPWDDSKIMNCITTGGGERVGHPSGKRGLTHRELAALQGFPGDHVFYGKDIRRQIGNAVPPCISKILLEFVRKHLQAVDATEQRDFGR